MLLDYLKTKSKIVHIVHNFIFKFVCKLDTYCNNNIV